MTYLPAPCPCPAWRKTLPLGAEQPPPGSRRNLPQRRGPDCHLCHFSLVPGIQAALGASYQSILSSTLVPSELPSGLTNLLLQVGSPGCGHGIGIDAISEAPALASFPRSSPLLPHHAVWV